MNFNINSINNNYFKANELPLVKVRNQVRITKINSFIFMCRIMSLMITLPGIIALIAVFCSSPRHPDSAAIIVLIITAIITLAILGFGVTQTLIFDLQRKQVYLEKKFITNISSKTLCDFKDVNMIGITSYKELYQDKHGEGTYTRTSIVIATKYNPSDFIEMLNANFISYTINPAKLTLIAKIIVVITGCTNFIDGGEENEIIAERNEQTKEIEYKLSPAPIRDRKLFSF